MKKIGEAYWRRIRKGKVGESRLSGGTTASYWSATNEVEEDALIAKAYECVRSEIDPKPYDPEKAYPQYYVILKGPQGEWLRTRIISRASVVYEDAHGMNGYKKKAKEVSTEDMSRARSVAESIIPERMAHAIESVKTLIGQGYGARIFVRPIAGKREVDGTFVLPIDTERK